MNNIQLVGADQILLNVHEYDLKNADFSVICVHGMAEHSKRYEELALFLNQKNIAVFTYDHRGHGRSILDGESHGYLGRDGFNKLVSDLDILVDHVKGLHPRKKVFLLGHSMGSFIVQRYIQNYKKISGVILSGSSYKIVGMRLMKWIGGSLVLLGQGKKQGKLMNQLSFGSFNKSFKPNRTDFDWLNRDSNEVDLYVNDVCCGFISTNQFYYDFIKGLIELQSEKNIRRVKKNLPMYLIAGEKDPVGHMGKKVKELNTVYKKYSNDVELKLYPEARHEILVEKNKEEVYQDIYKWLEKHK